MIKQQARYGPALQSRPVRGRGGPSWPWAAGWPSITTSPWSTFLAFAAYMGRAHRSGAACSPTCSPSAPRLGPGPSASWTCSTLEPPRRGAARRPLQLVGCIAGDVAFDDVTFGYLRSDPVPCGASRSGLLPARRWHWSGRPARASPPCRCSCRASTARDQRLTLRLDGTDVRDVTLDGLRRQIGVVFEESFLFSDTVGSNISYGRPDASPAEIEAAAEPAEAHAFITELPAGYDTVVGERGLTLSGGQRQRTSP